MRSFRGGDQIQGTERTIFFKSRAQPYRHHQDPHQIPGKHPGKTAAQRITLYRSLHLVVEVPIFLQNEKRLMKVEVQLRTIAMDFWANLEHKLRYKKDLSEDVLALTAAELSECAETSALLDRKMQRVRDIIEGDAGLSDQS